MSTQKGGYNMEGKMRKRVNVGMMILALLAVGMVLTSYTPARATDREQVQGLVDRARITFNDFMHDSNYVWLHENIDHAKAVLIFPEVIKGGFIWGGSGGTGVLLVRDHATGNWSEPAFYTIGSVTFGLQIGGEAAEVVMLAMTQKAVDSLLSSSVKLGGDASVAVGPVGTGAKANAGIPNVTADFISFAKTKGLYAGLNLEGSVVAVRDSLNKAYYGRDVRPTDIVIKHTVSNRGANELRAALKRAA
jgi:lipid-binding SYLF domain-containing protein